MVTSVGFSPNQGWSGKRNSCFACASRCTTRSCIASFLSAMPYLQFRYYCSGFFVSLQVGLTSSNCGNTQYDLAVSRSRSIRCFVLAVSRSRSCCFVLAFSLCSSPVCSRYRSCLLQQVLSGPASSALPLTAARIIVYGRVAVRKALSCPLALTAARDWSFLPRA